jgi:hypothetical protein
VLIGVQIIVPDCFTVHQLAAFHDARVHTCIQYDQVVLRQDTLQRRAVGDIARGVNDRVFLAEKTGDLLLPAARCDRGDLQK